MPSDKWCMFTQGIQMGFYEVGALPVHQNDTVCQSLQLKIMSSRWGRKYRVFSHGSHFGKAFDSVNLSLDPTSCHCANFVVTHWNGNVIILTILPLLAALKVVLLTSFSAPSDENFTKMNFRFSACDNDDNNSDNDINHNHNNGDMGTYDHANNYDKW